MAIGLSADECARTVNAKHTPNEDIRVRRCSAGKVGNKGHRSTPISRPSARPKRPNGSVFQFKTRRLLCLAKIESAPFAEQIGGVQSVNFDIKAINFWRRAIFSNNKSRRDENRRRSDPSRSLSKRSMPTGAS